MNVKDTDCKTTRIQLMRNVLPETKRSSQAKKKGKNSGNGPNTGSNKTEQNGSNKGIWSPPSAHEASFGNKRLIMGAIQIYDSKTKKWNLEKTCSPVQDQTPSASRASGTNNRSSGSNNSCRTQSSQGHVADGGANSASLDLDQEQEALIDMHLAQFKSNMREVLKK